MYGRILAVQDDRKVTLIAKTTFSVAIIQQQNRYNIYNVKTAVKDYLLAAIHLEDRRNYESGERIETIKGLVADIEQTEELLKCGNTIVIGDFNANPYDCLLYTSALAEQYPNLNVIYHKLNNQNSVIYLKGQELAEVKKELKI